MKREYYLFILTFLLAWQVQAQELIKGHLPGHAGESVSLSGYRGFESTRIAETTVDSLGNFSFASPADYEGVAFLQLNKTNGIEVLLNRNKSFTIQGNSIRDIDSLTCENNPETNTLYTYYKQQVAREKALSGWKYLQMVYKEIPYLKKFDKTGLLDAEIRSLEKEVTDFIKKQPEGSYLAWYLPLVSLARDIPVTLQRYPERIPRHIDLFMHTDFGVGRFYHSGLLSLVLKNYYFMLENMGKPLDSVYVEMNKATDHVLETMKNKKPEWLQETSLFLFNLFEQRSLFPAAEHLILAMLSQNSCTLDSKVQNRFEGYRAMKRGKQAPDIDFSPAIAGYMENSGNGFDNYLKGYGSLSEIGSKYKLVIFGSAGCPGCKEQLPEIKEMYPEIEKHDMEVVYISLDATKNDFEKEAAGSPWVSYFDSGGWDSRPVVDYHVFATPTMYLLDKNLDILNKIVSPGHLEAIMRILK